MTGFPFPSGPDGELGEPLLDALLDGRQLPADAPEQAHAVAEVLAVLAGPAEPGELAGEAAARSAFTRRAARVGARAAARRPGRRPHGARRSWPARGARLAAALIAAGAGLGGVAAGYAGVLPGPAQDFAHHLIGAPPAHRAGRHQPPARPGQGQPGGRKAGRPEAHSTPGPAAPGGGEGHWKPSPEGPCHAAGQTEAQVHAEARHLDARKPKAGLADGAVTSCRADHHGPGEYRNAGVDGPRGARPPGS
jgi:hypothetical protein